MTHHTIHFMQTIHAATLTGLQNVALGALSQGATSLTLFISSEGGNADQGFAAYHFLKSLPVPLTIHCIGNVESMAIIMFLAADNRLIVPHGRIKAHPLHWGFREGAIDHDRLREYVDSLDFDAKRYADIFRERTSGATKPHDINATLAGLATFLKATEAVDAGIATGVAEATVPKDAVRWWV